MEEIDELSRLLLILIRSGAGLKITYSFIRMIGGEETEIYWSRIKKILKFCILAESIFQIKELAMYYFQ